MRVWVGITFLAAAAISTIGVYSSVARAEQPQWSLIVYAATDEEEIAQHTDGPGGMIRKLLEMELPSNVELLMEQDTFLPHGVTRTIRRAGVPAIITSFGEHDSADPANFKNFIDWTIHHAQGRNRILMIGTHAWGWKGIIQDFTVPHQEDTMMPLREFSRVLREAPAGFDVLFLDACVLGNADVLTELRDTSPYLIVSQRETPYKGVPLEALFSLLSKDLDPRSLARQVPELYVSAYARDGSLATAEGEYDIVTVTALDMTRWDGFISDFTRLVGDLDRVGFRRMLKKYPSWPEQFSDMDSNVDLVELLKRLSSFVQVQDSGLESQVNSMLTRIGYPEDLAEASRALYMLRSKDDTHSYREFKIAIEADDILSEREALTRTKQRWIEANQDLKGGPKRDFFNFLEFDLITENHDGQDIRYFVVQGKWPKGEARRFSFRPWLPGTRRVMISQRDHKGEWHHQLLTREKDYFVTDRFPDSSFLLAEAHTQGAPFIHGIGINLKPQMNSSEERGTDPITGVKGPEYYRSLNWNRLTGWADLILMH